MLLAGAPLTGQQPSGAPAADGPEGSGPVKTSITIVEKVSAEAPASISTLEPRQLQQIPGVNLDDRLRMVPGFSLFRRSSSLAAHPTTQGISLRGIGSSGASRTLVLWDGVPLNDPFGGWIYWTRVSPEELGRVEVSRGASTSLFGDRALGGVITMFSREPERGSALRSLHGSYEHGNRNTHQAEAGYSNLFGRIGVSASARTFTTNGYYIVGENVRGAIDREANARFVAPSLKLDYLGTATRLFLRTDMLVEERRNGTGLQRNSTSLGNVAAHVSRDLGKDGITLLGYHTRGEFRSSFSAIAADRATERVTSIQSVPSEASGGAGYWRHNAARWNSLVGVDFVRVEGYSIDTFYGVTGAATGKLTGGGSVFQRGFFAQWDGRTGPAKIFLGARQHFTGMGNRFFSPSAGVAAGRGRWRGRSSVYRSFRAPTLNELYREFRQGNAVTQPNSQLAPESLWGVEAGLDYVGENGRAAVTLYRNSIDGIVTNVTLVSTPAQVIRQRRNAGRAVARGVELDLRQRVHSRLELEGSYLFADSRFSTGLRTPQVAKHYGSAQATYLGASTLLSAGVRSTASQFDDDLNRFLMPGFAVAHVSVRQRLRRGFSLQAVFENLLDREYLTAFTPVPQTGPPRLWRAGVRYDGRLF
jgi:outer membrane receptor protein involved in Fe transport